MTAAVMGLPRGVAAGHGRSAIGAKLRRWVGKLVYLAGSFSDYLEDKLLDHAFRNTSYTPATTVYVALFTVAPTDAGGGTEVSGGSYARVAVTFGASSGGAISNSAIVDFGTATANWGTIVAMGTFDASTAGNMLSWADLATSKAVNNGDAAQFPVGDLDITLT